MHSHHQGCVSNYAQGSRHSPSSRTADITQEETSQQVDTKSSCNVANYFDITSSKLVWIMDAAIYSTWKPLPPLLPSTYWMLSHTNLDGEHGLCTSAHSHPEWATSPTWSGRTYQPGNNRKPSRTTGWGLEEFRDTKIKKRKRKRHYEGRRQRRVLCN